MFLVGVAQQAVAGDTCYVAGSRAAVFVKSREQAQQTVIRRT
jgi:hypothetical protein